MKCIQSYVTEFNLTMNYTRLYKMKIILKIFICKRQAIKVISIITSIDFDLQKKNSFFVLKHVVCNYKH